MLKLFAVLRQLAFELVVEQLQFVWGLMTEMLHERMCTLQANDRAMVRTCFPDDNSILFTLTREKLDTIHDPFGRRHFAYEHDRIYNIAYRRDAAAMYKEAFKDCERMFSAWYGVDRKRVHELPGEGLILVGNRACSLDFADGLVGNRLAWLCLRTLVLVENRP